LERFQTSEVTFKVIRVVTFVCCAVLFKETWLCRWLLFVLFCDNVNSQKLV